MGVGGVLNQDAAQLGQGGHSGVAQGDESLLLAV